MARTSALQSERLLPKVASAICPCRQSPRQTAVQSARSMASLPDRRGVPRTRHGALFHSLGILKSPSHPPRQCNLGQKCPPRSVRSQLRSRFLQACRFSQGLSVPIVGRCRDGYSSVQCRHRQRSDKVCSQDRRQGRGRRGGSTAGGGRSFMPASCRAGGSVMGSRGRRACRCSRCARYLCGCRSNGESRSRGAVADRPLRRLRQAEPARCQCRCVSGSMAMPRLE